MTCHMTKVLKDFLINQKNKNKILVLKGKWGVGKTYFWENFIESNKDIIAHRIPTYSYVSLFGVSCSSELRQKVFNNGKPFSKQYSFWYIFNLEFWFSSIWATFLQKETWKKLFKDWNYWENFLSVLFSKKFWSYKYAHQSLSSLNKLGIIKKYAGDHTNAIESNYIKDILICFDDIERLDSKFPIEILMGYADELVQQKNCKIIFILNEDELEEKQKSAFNKYREKIVDIELTYSPTLNEQLEIVFDDKFIKYPIINKIINEQEYVNIIIKNMRVLRKINQILDDFIKICPDDLDPLIMDDFIKRAIYLSYCFYEVNSKVSFEIIKYPNSVVKYKPLNTAIKGVSEAQEEKAKEQEKKKFKGEYDQSLYNDLMLKVQQLHIHESSIFTEEIIYKLEHGLWSEEKLKGFILSEIERIDFITKQSEIRQRLDSAWRLYHSSFQNNLGDIVRIFEKELKDTSNYPYWDYGHFIHTIGYYYNFKKLENIQFSVPLHYIDHYTETNMEQLRQMTWEDSQYINLNTISINSAIRDYSMQKLDEIKSQKSKIPLSEFIKNLHGSGLSDEQKIYIQNLTLPEIKEWLKDLDDPSMSVYINNLRIWSAHVKNGAGVNNPDANTLINQALEEIASQNTLNKYRIDQLIKSKS